MRSTALELLTLLSWLQLAAPLTSTSSLPQWMALGNVSLPQQPGSILYSPLSVVAWVEGGRDWLLTAGAVRVACTPNYSLGGCDTTLLGDVRLAVDAGSLALQTTEPALARVGAAAAVHPQRLSGGGFLTWVCLLGGSTNASEPLHASAADVLCSADKGASWAPQPRLPAPVFAATASSFAGRLYVFGGQRGEGSASSSVWVSELSLPLSPDALGGWVAFPAASGCSDPTGGRHSPALVGGPSAHWLPLPLQAAAALLSSPTAATFLVGGGRAPPAWSSVSRSPLPATYPELWAVLVQGLPDEPSTPINASAVTCEIALVSTSLPTPAGLPSVPQAGQWARSVTPVTLLEVTGPAGSVGDASSSSAPIPRVLYGVNVTGTSLDPCYGARWSCPPWVASRALLAVSDEAAYTSTDAATWNVAATFDALNMPISAYVTIPPRTTGLYRSAARAGAGVVVWWGTFTFNVLRVMGVAPCASNSSSGAANCSTGLFTCGAAPFDPPVCAARAVCKLGSYCVGNCDLPASAAAQLLCRPCSACPAAALLAPCNATADTVCNASAILPEPLPAVGSYPTAWVAARCLLLGAASLGLWALSLQALGGKLLAVTAGAAAGGGSASSSEGKPATAAAASLSPPRAARLYDAVAAASRLALLAYAIDAGAEAFSSTGAGISAQLAAACSDDSSAAAPAWPAWWGTWATATALQGAAFLAWALRFKAAHGASRCTVGVFTLLCACHSQAVLSFLALAEAARRRRGAAAPPATPVAVRRPARPAAGFHDDDDDDDDDPTNFAGGVTMVHAEGRGIDDDEAVAAVSPAAAAAAAAAAPTPPPPLSHPALAAAATWGPALGVALVDIPTLAILAQPAVSSWGRPLSPPDAFLTFAACLSAFNAARFAWRAAVRLLGPPAAAV